MKQSVLGKILSKKTSLRLLTMSLVVIVGLGLWTVWLSWQVNSRRDQLFVKPDRIPEWILAIAPKPSEEIPISQAHFGEGQPNDPFWPGFGVICVQFDGKTTETTLGKPHTNVTLSLNGYSVEQLNSEWLRQGFFIRKGLILTSTAQNTPDGFNKCWQMSLTAGEYLASLNVKREKGSRLSYEWAFRLIDK